MTMIRWIALAAFAMLSAGCRDAAPAAEAAVPVDSIRPAAEALARFREGLPRVDSLAGGADSRDGLIARFADAVARQDTAAVRAMVLDRAEYAWIYFPSLQRMNPATNLQPEVMWMLHAQESEKGITRVMRRLGGGQWRYHRRGRGPSGRGPRRRETDAGHGHRRRSRASVRTSRIVDKIGTETLVALGEQAGQLVAHREDGRFNALRPGELAGAQRGSQHGDEMTPEGFLSNNNGGVLGTLNASQAAGSVVQGMAEQVPRAHWEDVR